jgi:hypothetical protein
LLNRPFLSPADDTPAAPLAESPFLSPADNTPAALLAESLVSFSFHRVGRRAARYVARFFLLPMLCPLFRQLNCSFLFVVDFLFVAPVAFSVVLLSMSGGGLIALFFNRRRGALLVARSF